MKNVFKIFALFIVFIGTIQWASAWEIDHFELTLSPEKASVGEAVDLTITAVDSNNEIVTDYTDKVLIFSSEDPKVELPIALQDSTYQFTEADQGKVKFENGVKFTSAGIKDLNVYDYMEDTIYGMVEIEISQEEKKEEIDIDIISPESGLTIPKNSVKVSGNTQKNHNVVVTLNGKETFDTTSNGTGMYEVEIDTLENGENTLVAQVLNADEKVIWTSEKISIKVEWSNTNLKNVKIIPEEVFTESMYEIEVTASKELTKVQAIVNDELIELTEKENGIYKWKANAPKEKGTFNIDIVLTGELGNEIKEMWAAELKVKTLDAATEVPVDDGDDVVVTVDEVDDETENTKVIQTVTPSDDPMKITGLKLVELKTKSILTWNNVIGAEAYNIYKKNESGNFELIETVKEARYEVEIINNEKITHDYFAVKAIGRNAKGETYEGDFSEATKVKTGPEMLILFIIALMIGGVFMTFNARKKA